MKKLVVILSLCVATSGVLVSGCSKSKTSATHSGNNAGSNAASDNPVELKIKWEVGKKYEMRMTFDQNTEMNLPNQPKPVKQQVKLAQDLDMSALKQLENGGWQLQLEFVAETMNVSQGDREVLSFDSTQNSAQDADDPAAPALRAVIGARLLYFTDADGKVEKIEGVDKLKDRVAAVGKPQQQADFQQLFSEDTLKRYGSFADSLPNRMVKKGDSWPFNWDIDTGAGTLTVNMNYTFKNWEQHDGRNCAHSVGTGSIATKTTSTTMGAVVEVQKGKISSDEWFDPELGMITDINSDLNMTLKITTRQQTLTQQLNQKVQFTLLDVTQ